MIIKPGVIVYDKDKNSYKIINSIGSGGFGSVYKIEKESDKSSWALKTLLENYQDEKLLKGLINEGNTAVKISHPNVIKYQFFHDGSLFGELPPYLIMELANQGTLRQIIEKQSHKKEFLPNSELKQYFEELINGMEAINAELVHRDIKPENILIKDNILKISDFGLSKIVEEQTRTSTFKGFGTIEYIAPECWQNGKNTIRIDVYSMGIVFFELATFVHPLEVTHKENILEWREAHLFQVPKRPEKINTKIDSVLSQIILRMIEKSPSKRFKDWAEIREEFKKEKAAPSVNNSLIENILKKRLEKDNEIKTEELKKQKRMAEIEEFRKLIKFQFNKEIWLPLKNLIGELNQKYLEKKMKIESENGNGYFIRLFSGQTLLIDYVEILEENCYRTMTVDDYGEERRITKLDWPTLHDRKVLAWGKVNNQYGRGFNILLLENKGEIYGDWVTMWNTNSAFNSGHRRHVEPFAFDANELERQIKCVGAMHIYNFKIEEFKLEIFEKFLDESINA
ncbi:MAG: serine/threonine-protein kinase [Candidatus Omnitrophota bacterium]